MKESIIRNSASDNGRDGFSSNAFVAEASAYPGGANEPRKFVRSARISIDGAVPGMVLAAEAKNEAGGVVLPYDTILSRSRIEQLDQFGISHIYIEIAEIQKKHNPLRNKRVVIVEDSPFFRHLFMKMLYKLGMFVVEDEENAEDGIRSALRCKPDLLIVDMHLPGKDGDFAISSVRSKLADAKYLAVSVDRKKETIVRALKAGADDFILKPVQWDDFRRRLDGLFD